MTERIRQTDVPSFRSADDAFRLAILTGRLSENPQSPLYAGHFMYMGTYNDVDTFKRADTREYLK